MTGYNLSKAARLAEERYSSSRRTALETKEIIGTGGLSAWSGASRQDGTNFRTNQVTLANYQDSATGGSSVGLTATWACVNLIAGTIGSLPLMVYRRDGDVRRVARDHPLYYRLHESPNFHQTAMDFWEFIAAGIELQGNSFARIDRRDSGDIVALTPVRPDAVTVKREGGRLVYRWSIDGKPERHDEDDVLHIRGPLGDAMGGASALSVCRAAFASARAAESAARSTFDNGMRPSGVLSTDPSITLTKDQRQEFDELLADRFQGAINAGRPMLLDRGMTWQQINMTPEDAQMLESRKFSGEEICRIFGVPPAMVGYGDKSSNWGTGKEVDVLGFQKLTLRKRLKRIEQALMKQLLTARDRLDGVTIEFNMDGLLRGDSEGRSKFYDAMTRIGAMTINEVRALENLPPVPGGDQPRMQMQNVPITQAGQEE